MADATPDTTPALDGLARVQEDGTVDTGGKPAFVWCEDESTGHRFDLPVRALPRSGARVVEGYPLNFKRNARPAKSRMHLAADPAETDVHGDVEDQTPSEPAGTGDEQHAAASSDASGESSIPAPVEAGAPEVEPSGDDQQKAAAAQADGKPRNRRN